MKKKEEKKKRKEKKMNITNTPTDLRVRHNKDRLLSFKDGCLGRREANSGTVGALDSLSLGLIENSFSYRSQHECTVIHDSTMEEGIIDASAVSPRRNHALRGQVT